MCENDGYQIPILSLWDGIIATHTHDITALLLS